MESGQGNQQGKIYARKKLTLPLIHTLQIADGHARRRLIKLVKRAPKDPEAVREVMDAILNGPGLKYAREKMMALRNEAVEILNDFEEGDAKKALIDMLDFTIQRNK